jgi:hypothetical protein
VDKHYAHYYDGFTRNGKKVMGYGWGNGQKSVAAVMEDWKRALGERIPVVIFKDWEEASVFQGLTPSRMTDLIRATEDAAMLNFDVGHGNYSRANWLDNRVVAGDWIHELLWWLAHWIYPPSLGRQARAFVELDLCLPIDNSFTPYRGSIVKLKESKVGGWQASSRLQIVPRGTSDGGYFLKTFLDKYFGGGPPPGPGPEEELRKEAQELRDKGNEIVQSAGRLDDIADRVEDM